MSCLTIITYLSTLNRGFSFMFLRMYAMQQCLTRVQKKMSSVFGIVLDVSVE